VWCGTRNFGKPDRGGVARRSFVLNQEAMIA